MTPGSYRARLYIVPLSRGNLITKSGFLGFFFSLRNSLDYLQGDGEFSPVGFYSLRALRRIVPPLWEPADGVSSIAGHLIQVSVSKIFSARVSIHRVNGVGIPTAKKKVQNKTIWLTGRCDEQHEPHTREEEKEVPQQQQQQQKKEKEKCGGKDGGTEENASLRSRMP